MSGAGPARFAGKVLVVTGAVQGIGLTVAQRLADEQATLMLVDRSDLVHQVAEELRDAGGGAGSVVADLEQYQGAADAMAAAKERFGRIDGVINNVGGTIWARPYAEYEPEQIQAEIQRSLFPTLWCCRAALPYLLEAGQSVIVNVSSVATRGVNRVPYSAAKGGVNALTASLAMEYAGHGIRVVGTAPGGTEAPERKVPRGPSAADAREKAWYQEVVDQTVDSSLLKRYGTLEEQAGAILFLASDEASYITGTVLPIAGGDLG